MSEQDAALSPEELFDKIVQLTDVPKMLGGGIVKRCLRRGLCCGDGDDGDLHAVIESFREAPAPLSSR